jgi:pimeloyl-ACP methyl ester carboxylesterase
MSPGARGDSRPRPEPDRTLGHERARLPPIGTPRASTVRPRLSTPLRAVLHRLLLRGLRAPRLSHAPGWHDGPFGGQGLVPFRVRGRRGQVLSAWLAVPGTAHPARPAPVVVAVHGWGANGSTLASMVEPLVRAGIAVALFDAASHGESSGEAFSSLPRFADDLGSVREALRRHPALDCDRTALLGHSVGAAAALLHAARHGDVRAVVSLSSFAHPREVMERWLQAHHIPRRWVGTAILEHVQDVIGERFDLIAPERQLTYIDCPVMLVHGAADRTVPLSDAHRLHALLRRGELLVVEGDHDLRASLAPHAAHLVRFLCTHLECPPIPHRDG